VEKVLLIGGAGYIGLPVSKHLLENGYEVHCLDNFTYGHNQFSAGLLGKNFHFFYGDFCENKPLETCLGAVDYVVILGGLVGDPVTKKFPDASRRINSDGIKHVIELIEKSSVKRTIFVSTCSNYGLIEAGQKADEAYPLNPLSLYAKSKVENENFLLKRLSVKSQSATVLRFATAFGLSPRMRFDLTINEFTRDLSLGKELLVFDADTWRPYCHVNDFARLIECVLKADKNLVSGEIYNAGGDQNNFTKRMIVEKVLNFCPNSRVVYRDKGGDPRNYIVDFSKVRKKLGFLPKYSVEDGISEISVAVKSGIFDTFSETNSLNGNFHLV
jgi:nucleoside-diphosphate-sugar epimerase